MTYLPLLLKALSVALSSHPTVNSSLAPGSDSLLLHRDHNIGVAMATGQGLVVPNIKQVRGGEGPRVQGSGFRVQGGCLLMPTCICMGGQPRGRRLGQGGLGGGLPYQRAGGGLPCPQRVSMPDWTEAALPTL